MKTFKQKRGGRTREGGGAEAGSQKILSVRLRSIDLSAPISNVEPQKAFKQRNGW